MRSRRGELRVLDLLIACTALDSWEEQEVKKDEKSMTEWEMQAQ